MADVDIPVVPTGPIGGVLQRPGVIPNTLQKYITYGPTDVQTISAGGARMDINFSGSTAKSIDLEKFFIGCVAATRASLTAAPMGGDISVTCNRADGTKVGPQTFPFKISLGQLSAEMQPAKPEGFTHCESIEFANPRANQILPGVTDAALAGLVDTVEYKLNV